MSVKSTKLALNTRHLKAVYSAPLTTLNNTTLDLSPYFSAENYRFIDADAFIHHRTLTIHESSVLPVLFYTAVSYVWSGLPASPSELARDGQFRVWCGFRNGDSGTPRDDGGPISLRILGYACQWACTSSSPYVWLDRLCIMQTSDADKAWQITRMYDVYERSEQCVVFPGGLQRLASVFDETSWADRAWTYQEAVVTWDYAVVLTRDWHRPRGEQHWLVEGECHWQYLMQLFLEGKELITTTGQRPFLSSEGPCLILGRNGQALDTLQRIIEYSTFNSIARDGEEKIGEEVIRQLVLQGVAMRTSSRPVDMVFSILGLVGVQETFRDAVQVGDFGERERFRATLALMEAMFRLEDDEGEGESKATGCGSSTLVDIPLWHALNISPSSYKLDTATLPTLQDLAQLLDHDTTTELALSRHPDITMQRTPLLEWTTLDATQAEEFPGERASVILAGIPDDELLSAYHGDRDRVLVQHEEEGVMELCRKLELKTLSEDDGLVLDPVVFGWSLKLDSQPFIRFYKFDISHLIL